MLLWRWTCKAHNDIYNSDILARTIVKDSFRVRNGVVNQRVEKGQPGLAFSSKE